MPVLQQRVGAQSVSIVRADPVIAGAASRASAAAPAAHTCAAKPAAAGATALAGPNDAHAVGAMLTLWEPNPRRSTGSARTARASWD
jgi:hypothetical protein